MMKNMLMVMDLSRFFTAIVSLISTQLFLKLLKSHALAGKFNKSNINDDNTNFFIEKLYSKMIKTRII